MRRAVVSTACLTGLLLCASAASAASPITEYALGGSGSVQDITPGVGGNVWFTQTHPGPTAVGYITPAGVAHSFEQADGLNAGNLELGSIVAGPDGNMWFTDQGEKNVSPPAIGRATPAGSITEFSMVAGSLPSQIVSGPLGRLWFSDSGTFSGAGDIGWVTPNDGTVTEQNPKQFTGIPTGLSDGPGGALYFGACSPAIGFVAPDGSISSSPTSCSGATEVQKFVTGSDGNAWFIRQGQFGEVEAYPSMAVHMFSLPHPPIDLVAGPDGHLWYAYFGGIGRIALPPAGSPPGTAPTYTDFTLGLNAHSIVTSLTAGPDGNVWFSDGGCQVQVQPSGNSVQGWCAIGRITPSGQIMEFPIDSTVGLPYKETACFGCSTQPGKIIAGPDGNIWFLEAGDPSGIGRVNLAVADATSPPPGGGGSTPPPSGGGSASVSAPQVANPHQTHKLWRLGTHLPTIARASAPVGTTFTFSLNEPAAVTLQFTTPSAGRRVRRRCVAPTHGSTRRPACTRTTIAGALGFTGHTGLNRVGFEGRLSGAKRLRPGSYTLTITARSAGKTSNPATLKFTIVA